jgi:DinB superfamily
MDQSLTTIEAILRTTAPRWQALAEALPEDALRRPAAPGEWSAAECLRHLRDAERVVFRVRLRAFLDGTDLVPYDPTTQGGVDLGETTAALLDELVQLRSENLALLNGLTPADLERTVHHGEYGTVRLGQMLHQWAAHDLSHTVQAEEALMQPLIDGAGPWRPVFADHDRAAATTA